MMPKNNAEFLALYHQNETTSGFGVETSVHMPCPFCARKNWLEFRIIDAREALRAGAVCEQCHRGARMIITGDKDTMTFELVQFAGDDPPDWFPANPRRIHDLQAAPIEIKPPEGEP